MISFLLLCPALLLGETLLGVASQDNEDTLQDQRRRQDLMPSNKTLLPDETLQGDVSHENEESFQDQEKYHHYGRCNETLLEETFLFCWSAFNAEMAAVRDENWCDWEQVIRPYHELTYCMEYIAGYIGCYFPNLVSQDIFVRIHEQFFLSCADPADEQFPDAPPGVVLALTLVPVSFIPVLVFLVVWKSKVRE